MKKLNWLSLIASSCLAVSLLLVSCDSGGDGDDATKIACLGDSLTAGMSATTVGVDDASKSYPAYLETQLNALGQGNYDVINKGVSGDLAAQGLAHVDDVIAEDPDGVIILLGANDFLEADAAELEAVITTIETNLTAIVNELDNGKREIYVAKFYNATVAGDMLTDKEIPSEEHASIIAACDALYAALAADTGVTIIEDIWAGVWGVHMSADGIHPVAAGYEIMAENILNTLAE